jgi:hypothetical protein
MYLFQGMKDIVLVVKLLLKMNIIFYLYVLFYNQLKSEYCSLFNNTCDMSYEILNLYLLVTFVYCIFVHCMYMICVICGFVDSDE